MTLIRSSLLLLLLLLFGIFMIKEVYGLGGEEREDEKKESLSTDEEEKEDDNIFHPTHEWQEIKKGQSVPAGLHYRINLQTGLKEAKLLEKEEEKEGKEGEKVHSTSLSELSEGSDSNTDVQVSKEKEFYGHSDRRGVINKSTKLFTRAELREMLKKIKDDSHSDIIPLLTTTTSNEEAPKEGSEQDTVSHSTSSSNSKSVQELKEMLTFHVDVEIMLQRLQILINPKSTPDQLVNALEDIEYYVHQIDNARDFDVLGGLSVVIRLLNYTDDHRVQSTAALVLGAATQGNPVVQKLATSYNALPTLLSLLTPSQTELLLRRTLFALGSLLRGQPTIIQTFLGLGGIERLSQIIDSDVIGEPVFIKIIVLLTDLLSVEGIEETSIGTITISYIQTRLSERGWCHRTSHFLQTTTNPIAIEKCVLLMNKLLPVCDYSTQYKLLHKIKKRWNRNGEEQELMDTVKNMLEIIKSTSKDEL